MADDEQSRTRAKAWTADTDAARRRAGFLLPAGLADRAAWLGRLLSEWAIAEVAPGRLLPWLPVAFGSASWSISRADREPAWWAAAGLAFAGIARCIAARRRAIGFALALAFAAIALGFATATLKTARIAHPVLQTGVERDRRRLRRGARGARAKATASSSACIVSKRPRLSEAPERVRVAVRKGTAPAVGSFVALKAHLSPPLAPLRPGGYDFARDMFFQRIGASGYALGQDQDCGAAGQPRPLAALRRIHRRHARGDRQPHPRRHCRAIAARSRRR